MLFISPLCMAKLPSLFFVPLVSLLYPQSQPYHSQEIFGFTSWSCIEQFNATSLVLQGNDVLVFLPTGHGKSLIFALAASVLNGTTFVLEPLIEVQVELARKFNAVGIKSAVYARDKNLINAEFDGLFKDSSKDVPFKLGAFSLQLYHSHSFLFFSYCNLVFYSPESLAGRNSDLLILMRRLHKANLFDIAVLDEAHKIALWGKEFRPEFNETYKLRASFVEVPFLVRKCYF